MAAAGDARHGAKQLQQGSGSRSRAQARAEDRARKSAKIAAARAAWKHERRAEG